jgi:hypothetical protein
MVGRRDAWAPALHAIGSRHGRSRAMENVHAQGSKCGARARKFRDASGREAARGRRDVQKKRRYVNSIER